MAQGMPLAGDDGREGSARNQPAGAGKVLPGDFPQRSVPSSGVFRPPSVHELLTTSEHLRIYLENWEKQWADVLRYERAVVRDGERWSAALRAFGRSGTLALAGLSISFPVVTDAESLAGIVIGQFSLRELAVALAAGCLALGAASLWYGSHLLIVRRQKRKDRTRPRKPPVSIDAHQLLSLIQQDEVPPYYRERDVDVALNFGWTRDPTADFGTQG